jgi:hypothetical protein
LIPRIVVEDVGADAVLVEVNGEPVLVLSPHQSFASAVSAVERYVPELDQDRARALIRAHLPQAPDLELAGVAPSQTPPAERVERRWMSAKLGVGIAAVAAAGGIVLGQLGNQVATSTAETELRSASSPFDSATFRRLAAEGDLMCTPIGSLRARCTDWDGSVMLAEASVGPDKLTVIFSYGKERIGVAVFGSPALARAWAVEPATRELYPNARAGDRFVIWGTDQVKVDSYLARIGHVGSRPLRGPVSRFIGGPPLPPRRTAAPRVTLEGMLMGALGVTAQQVDHAAGAGVDRAFPPVQASALALLLGLPPAGDSERPPSTTPAPSTTPTSPGMPTSSSGPKKGKATPSRPPRHGPDDLGPPGHQPDPEETATTGLPRSASEHTPHPHTGRSRKPGQEKKQSPGPDATMNSPPAAAAPKGQTSGRGAASPAPESRRLP